MGAAPPVMFSMEDKWSAVTAGCWARNWISGGTRSIVFGRCFVKISKNISGSKDGMMIWVAPWLSPWDMMMLSCGGHIFQLPLYPWDMMISKLSLYPADVEEWEEEQGGGIVLHEPDSGVVQLGHVGNKVGMGKPHSFWPPCCA